MKCGHIIGVTVLLCGVSAPLVAQVALPVPVPSVPPVNLPGDLDRTVSGVTAQLDPRRLSDVRPLRIRELLRTYRDLLEADPKGAPMLRSEVLAFSPSAAALDRAKSAGYSVLRERALDGLDATLVVLRAPAGMSTRRALKQLRALDPAGTYDFNHVYTDSGPVGAEQPATAGSAMNEPPRLRLAARIGLIDGGVDLGHPVFKGATIKSYGCHGKQVASGHGTAVASLIVGRSERFHGAAPGAELFAADVYCGQPTGGAVDAVADAFAWLSRERVPVINVSLVGPPNVTLENVIRIVNARGHLVVAAVGNDGAAAKPLYPAAYPGVVGVTAVDSRRRALVEAGRGKQVDLAAPGADIAAAGAGQTYVAVRGTSFAAPIAAGLLVAELHEPDAATAERALATLTRQALDLGSRGRDSTYGEGLVGDALRIELAAARLADNK